MMTKAVVPHRTGDSGAGRRPLKRFNMFPPRLVSDRCTSIIATRPANRNACFASRRRTDYECRNPDIYRLCGTEAEGAPSRGRSASPRGNRLRCPDPTKGDDRRGGSLILLAAQTGEKPHAAPLDEAVLPTTAPEIQRRRSVTGRVWEWPQGGSYLRSRFLGRPRPAGGASSPGRTCLSQ